MAFYNNSTTHSAFGKGNPHQFCYDDENLSRRIILPDENKVRWTFPGKVTSFKAIKAVIVQSE